MELPFAIPGLDMIPGLGKKDLASAGPLLFSIWQRVSKLPGGGRLFGKVMGQAAPYTGTIDPEVVELRPGHARVRMRDRRGVRNHLNSVHAMALCNLAEAATGLAVVTSLPPTARAILVGFQIEYVKKARGTLIAECDAEVPDASVDRDVEIEGLIRDRGGDVVARATARWRVGPVKRA